LGIGTRVIQPGIIFPKGGAALVRIERREADMFSINEEKTNKKRINKKKGFSPLESLKLPQVRIEKASGSFFRRKLFFRKLLASQMGAACGSFCCRHCYNAQQ